VAGPWQIGERERAFGVVMGWLLAPMMAGSTSLRNGSWAQVGHVRRQPVIPRPCRIGEQTALQPPRIAEYISLY